MTIKPPPVKSWDQLSLLPHEDLVYDLRVTIHVHEQLATISLTSWGEPSEETLISTVRPAVPLHRLDDAVREVGFEFTAALRRGSGPFPH
jgi:hypothetical protein